MLRLHRHRHQSKSGDRFDFQFSSFKALQVPKGWDKLVVSFVSVETGKTIAKTTKASVRNGSCEWTETISESVRLSEEDSAKEIENCLFKLTISMGLARTSILGEATINVAEYLNSRDSVPVSLALKKCTHGTTLQMKIQCMTPRLKFRDEDSKPIENHQEIDTKSDGSGSARSQRSSFTKDFSLNSNSGEFRSRETSFSLSESHQSYDSAEGSVGGEDISENSVSPGTNVGSEISNLNNETSFNSQLMGSSLTSTSSDKNLREETAEELRAEAQMWERNARKLMLDLEASKVDFSELSKSQESLKKELEDLKSSSNDLAREELRFQMEESADLASQLKRSHESNIELVSVLQELEETIERQRKEIEDLVALQAKSGESLEDKNQEIENSRTFLDVENEYRSKLLDREEEIFILRAKLSEKVKASGGNSDANLVRDIKKLKEKVQELERDCNELTEENLELVLKLKEVKNESTRMSASVEFPERTSFEFQLTDHFLEESSEKRVVEETSLDDQVSEEVSNLRSKEEEISALRQCRSELEAKVFDLQEEKAKIQEQMKAALQESEFTSKCLSSLQNDLAVLRNTVDAQRKSSELETSNRELEQENARFSILVAGLEGQLRDFESQLESSQMELEKSKSHSTSLNLELDRLRNEMQSAVEHFDSLHESSGELRNENMGLRGCCSNLETKLEESYKNFADCSKKVDVLELYLCSFVTEFESKEKRLSSELDALVEENLRHKEKAIEVQNLELEVKTLMRKLFEAHEQNERLASDSESELKRVSSENEKLMSLVENYKSTEAQLKANVSDLELKLTVSEYQRQQLSEDSSYLKLDLKKLENLENELGETRAEREKLEGFVRAMSEECRELKSEKCELLEKVKLLKSKLVDDQVEQEPQRARKASKTNTKVNPVHNDKGKSANQRRENRRNPSHKESGGGGGFESPNGSPRDKRAELGSKMHSLEEQLAKALEENNKYKAQLSELNALGKPTSESELVSKTEHEHTKSILEAELRDLRERYSNMSLKYAEVETQREELVMKLKSSSKSSKRWF